VHTHNTHTAHTAPGLEVRTSHNAFERHETLGAQKPFHHFAFILVSGVVEFSSTDLYTIPRDTKLLLASMEHYKIIHTSLLSSSKLDFSVGCRPSISGASVLVVSGGLCKNKTNVLPGSPGTRSNRTSYTPRLLIFFLSKSQNLRRLIYYNILEGWGPIIMLNQTSRKRQFV
jgi:hypothetical protein